MAMFGYMTDITTVSPLSTEVITAEGDDLISLLYHFLDEWLFVFSAEPFFIPRVCMHGTIMNESIIIIIAHAYISKNCT